ncbi:MAG: excinuclease ABC subunit UvrA [Planctomycetaceae bacterium]|nr:excinuclease ABC subunit UvrA [Planctomycetaceae bacterium]
MSEHITLYGVRVHNLKSVHLELPYEKLIVFCGRSGSGKSSLAIDTLFAEGQRRYIESFSAYTRQYLEKLEKPDAERIEGIPPAIAVTSKPFHQVSRSTVGTATETADYLRLLFSKIGTLICHGCGRKVRNETPETIVKALKQLPQGTRAMIAFAPNVSFVPADREEFESEWRELGFVRGVILGQSFRLDEGGIPQKLYDRLVAAIPTSAGNKRGTPDGNAKNGNASVEDENNESPDEWEDMTRIRRDEELAVREKSIEKNNETEETEDADELETKSVDHIVQDGEDEPAEHQLEEHGQVFEPPKLFFIVDRIVTERTNDERLRETLEDTRSHGDGRCWIFYKLSPDVSSDQTPESVPEESRDLYGLPYFLDGEMWALAGFSRHFECEICGIRYPQLEPKLFSFNSPLGACPKCEGFGNLMTFDLDLIVPNRLKSLRDGAIAPWNSPSYKNKLEELLKLAPVMGIPVNVPFSELTREQASLLINGSSKHKYQGLNAFFGKLQKQKYKMHIRVFLSRWRSFRPCPACHGARLRPEALAVHIGNAECRMQNAEFHAERGIQNTKLSHHPDFGHSSHEPHHSAFCILHSALNIAEISVLKISDALVFLQNLKLSPWQKEIVRTPLREVIQRLQFLEQVGLGYLTLDRTMRTLSGGEQRRVGLTTALGSSLVNMLYVLDEPSIGLHPNDTDMLLRAIETLRDRGNTVVVVEHEEAILRAADRIVEVGPEAGISGGHITFEGSLDEMLKSETSLTGSYLSGRRTGGIPSQHRSTEHGFLELTGATGHNLKNLSVRFPLGLLCVVTGVSGSGKSTLIQETLYPALCKKLGHENAKKGLPCDQMLGTGQLDDVILVDQSPIGRSPRSNPVTYLKIFDEIRNVFADTVDAKTHNFTAGYFSFNVDGGRCNVCQGDGVIVIDMQFMADMYMKCPQCHGTRYQREILEITYRGKNIAEVLDMTVREAFAFFRGQPKVQTRLKRLIDVGLDYVKLGQLANTLSGGELQRLKLAAYLSQSRKGHSLFLLDEPTTGLHFADIVQLLDCFDALIDTGHSLIVVEHNLQMIRAADYVIDLGPGAAEYGGQIIAEGTPEQIAACEASVTGKYLRPYYVEPQISDRHGQGVHTAIYQNSARKS